jgi:segregation and condensation protein A
MNRTEQDTYTVKLDKFEGPFDLLLYLVKNSKININDLLISDITQQFLTFLGESSDLNIEKTSSFILTTSILIYLKSRSLLPQEIDLADEEADDRREFVDNLIEYQKYKSAARIMRSNIERETVLIRKQPQLMIDFKDNENWEEVSIMDLIMAFSRVAKEVDKTVFRSIEMEEVSIDDKINEILDFLKTNKTLDFYSLFPERNSKYLFIVTFLSLLELVKMKKIFILQHKLFGTIKILRRDEDNLEQ